VNLAKIRQNIEREIRHAPDVKAHREELNDRINEALHWLLSSERWSFRQRVKRMRLYKQQVITSANYTLNADDGGGANKFAIKFSAPTGWDLADKVDGCLGARASFSAWTTSTLVYEGVFLVEESGFDSSEVYIVLDPRYLGNAEVDSGASLTLDWTRYRLPRDCEDVYSVMFRDSDDGPVTELAMAQENRIMLNRDDSPSTPKWFILDPNYSTAKSQESTEYYPADYVPAPHAPLTLTENSSGSLTLLGTYEYAYAWAWGGMVSGISPIASVTLTGANQTVDITDIGEIASTAGGRLGRQRHIYRRQIFSDYEGPWWKITTLQGPETATFSDDGSFLEAPANPTGAVRLHRYHTGVQNRWIRFYPETDTDTEVELRYLARAPVLETDADVPQMPEAFHQVLVHLVVRDLAANHDSQRLAKFHERKAGEIIDAMRRRHLGSTSTRFQKNTILSNQGIGWPLLKTPSYTSDA
jgi:hypothetical protein